MMARTVVIGFLLATVSSQVNADRSERKCCSANETYRIGYDDCAPSNETSKAFSEYGVLTQCPDGHVPKVMDIGEVDIRSDGLYSQQGELLAADFCIEQLHYKHERLVVRYCLPDPCADQPICLRKCCPNGFVFNHEIGKCQPSNVAFTHTSGVALLDGVFPNCTHGSYIMNKEDFFIESNGVVNFTADFNNDLSHSDYCVDHFITYEGSVVLEGLRCFPHPTDFPETNDVALNIYPYALYFSSIFLIATFIVYAILPELHNTQGLMVMAYTASMTVMFVGLGTIQIAPGMSDAFCIGSAIIVHYAFLATFTWLNALCFDIWHSMSHARSADPVVEKRRFLLYSLYAWGVPLVIVVVGQIADNVKEIPDWFIKPRFGLYKCFFAVRDSYFAYLYGPVSVLLLANLFFFVASSVVLCRRSGDKSARHYDAKRKFFAILVLFFVMGVTWITEVVSFVFDHLSYLWIPTDILNIASGLFVFLIFVCRRQVWNLLVRKYPRIEALAKLCPCCCGRSKSVDLQNTCADDTLAKSQESTI